MAHDAVPGRSTLWHDYITARGERTQEVIDAAKRATTYASGIGTPADIGRHIAAFQDSGIDQVIFLQQAGNNRHEHICESLQLFADEVMGPFKAEVAQREARKAEALAPYLEAAMQRKRWMPALAEADIPVVRASAAKAGPGR